MNLLFILMRVFNWLLKGSGISFIALIWIFGTGSATADKPQKLTFFGNNEFIATNTGIVADFQMTIDVFNLDAQRNLELDLGKDLPSNDDEARRIADSRLAAIDEAEIMRIFEGAALLLKWDIKKVPAMVMGEGEYVIYGVTDTSAALRMFFKNRTYQGD